MSFIKEFAEKFPFALSVYRMPHAIVALKHLTIAQQTKALQSSHPNPLNKFGRKCYSQTDEDGITLEILRRIGFLENGVYAEFGVGNGMENNTLILAALGWKGFWVGGEKLKFPVKNNKRFNYIRDWITRENITGLIRKGLAAIDSSALDVISLDLDGNDIYFAEEMLNAGFKPKVFIVEYNAKFPPPVKFQIPYDPKHVWAEDDYFGGSLSSFNDLFLKFDYKLVCCNAHSGCNAFFVQNSYSDLFTDVPTDLNKIYVEPRYYMYHKYGHTQSIKTVMNILSDR